MGTKRKMRVIRAKRDRHKEIYTDRLKWGD